MPGTWLWNFLVCSLLTCFPLAKVQHQDQRDWEIHHWLNRSQVITAKLTAVLVTYTHCARFVFVSWQSFLFNLEFKWGSCSPCPHWRALDGITSWRSYRPECANIDFYKRAYICNQCFVVLFFVSCGTEGKPLCCYCVSNVLVAFEWTIDLLCWMLFWQILLTLVTPITR